MTCRILFCLLMLWATPTFAARHAFILGNSDYKELDDLQNTKSDATAYSDAFEQLGFNVSYHEDLGLIELGDAFEAFVNRVAPGDDVTFIYSGHGWSNGRVNYLIPIDAPLRGSDNKLQRVSVALRNGYNGILDQLEASGARLTVAIIDACRNNPFKPVEGKKTASMSRGLARIQPARGTFVVFSAGVGQEALDRLPQDGTKQNLSVFTRTFIPHLLSGLYLEDAISEAQIETAELALTYQGHLQHPAYYDQSLGKTCLSGKCSSETMVIADPAPPTSQCDAMYNEAKEIGACYAYEAYIGQCSAHKFSSFASSYLKRQCEPEKIAVIISKAPNTSGEDKTANRDLLRQCDVLTAHASDKDNPFGVEPVAFASIDHSPAIPACKAALEAFPDELRMMFQLGRAISAADKGDAEALRWYRMAAERGNAAAQNKLGTLYEYGNGVVEEDAEAVRWYRKAAEQGNELAQTRLGVMYDIGNGVVEDDAEATRWYKEAAEQGHVSAQRLLGFMYSDEEGVGKDLAEAAFWWRMAAKQGNVSSRIALSNMFEDARKAKALQLKLKELGFYNGELDGEFGSGSQSALDAYILSRGT